jgi:hypothetical protein
VATTTDSWIIKCSPKFIYKKILIPSNLFIFLYIFIGIASYLYILFNSAKKLKWSYLPVISFFSLALLVGLRDLNVGIDTHKFYLWTRTGLDLEKIELLYWNLASLGKGLFGANGTNIFVSIVTIFSYYYFVTKVADRVAYDDRETERYFAKGIFVIMVFLLTMASSDFLLLAVNQTRQGLAATLLVFGAFLLYNNSRFSIPVLLLAPFAHFSAIFVLLIILLTKYVNLKIHIPLIVVVSIIFWQFDLVFEVATYIPSDYIQRKLSSAVYQSALTSETTLIIKTLISAFFVFLLFAHKCNNSYMRGFFDYFYSIFGLIIASAILFLDFGEGSNRIQRYAMLFLPVLLVLFAMRINPKRISLIVTASLGLSYLIFMITYPSILRTIGI